MTTEADINAAREHLQETMRNDPRMAGLLGHSDYQDAKLFKNGMAVAELPSYTTDQPAASHDGYHMFAGVGFNASNTSHHHKWGDVAILYAKTSPISDTGYPVKERYIIVVDHWTGARIKVVLPHVENPERSR